MREGPGVSSKPCTCLLYRKSVRAWRRDSLLKSAGETDRVVCVVTRFGGRRCIIYGIK